MIKEIRLEKIKPHPKNPRLDLGDLTELSESIKEHGVMQNLTVIDDPEGDYICLIGHRRMAAAKLAGLETVPCEVVSMDEKEQIATMLMENMQRVDLTLYEQVQGFQTMLDLDYSVTDICRKTGLAETTVRHRLKMGDLDQNLFRQKVDETEQLSINDIIKLEQIESESKRNEVFKLIGTSNFNWALNNAIDEQKREKFRQKVISLLADMHVENPEKDYWNYQYVESISSGLSEEKLSEKCREIIDEWKGETLYLRSVYGGVEIRIEKKDLPTADPEREARNKKEETRKEHYIGMRELRDKIEKSWKDYIISLSDKKIQDKSNVILKYAAIEVLDECYDPEILFVEYGLINDEDRTDLGSEKFWAFMRETAAINPLRTLLYATFCFITMRKSWMDYNVHYVAGPEEEYVKEFMTEMGYKFSDEEKAFMDGTHELYLEKEE